jgi:DUF218 domain-containing protein
LKNTILAAVLAGVMSLIACHPAQSPGPGVIGPRFVRLDLSRTDNILSAKLFPFFLMINQQPPVAAAIYNSPEQKSLAGKIRERYAAALKTCNDVTCLAQSFRITSAEIEVFAKVTMDVTDSRLQNGEKAVVAADKKSVPDATVNTDLSNNEHKIQASKPAATGTESTDSGPSGVDLPTNGSKGGDAATAGTANSSPVSTTSVASVTSVTPVTALTGAGSTSVGGSSSGLRSNKKMRGGAAKLPTKRAAVAMSVYLNYTDAVSASKDAFAAINNILDVYLAGKPPRYPKIDGSGFTSSPQEYLDKVKKSVQKILSDPATTDVSFTVPMLTALKVLELNGRDEAARYEPLTGDINKDAFKKVATTEWKNFQYSAILVPGLGPQLPGVALDPGAARRCELAVAEYKKGLAPFIIVSGGHVHPNKTPYSEAIEMRKYLINELKLPPSAVIAEPHARHTTTNIRNAGRIIFAFGMPPDKPVMIVTDVLQSTYILMMKGRFIEELGYLPYKELTKSATGIMYFLPDSSAVQLNPLDPLDP